MRKWFIIKQCHDRVIWFTRTYCFNNALWFIVINWYNRLHDSFKKYDTYYHFLILSDNLDTVCFYGSMERLCYKFYYCFADIKWCIQCSLYHYHVMIQIILMIRSVNVDTSFLSCLIISYMILYIILIR